LVVGGMSGLAILTGVFFGRSKRVWCRYLCPVMSIFSLLSRCSVLHFKVDRCRWDSAQKPVPKPVDCPLLLDVRRLSSNEKCNMCGRCSGYRGAVELAWRRPGAEIESLRDDELRPWDAVAVCYGLFGLSAAGIHWHSGLVEIAAVALVLGSLTAGLLLFAASGRRILAIRLSYGLIPLAGLGLALGAAEHSLTLLAAEGFETHSALSWLRSAGVFLGLLWSGHLGWVLTGELPVKRRAVAVAGYGAALVVLACTIQFAPPSF
jgi:hypothetical protein